MHTPQDYRSSQVIGIVESVSPRELRVGLLDEAPGATSLNAGFAQRFPRINSWVLVPSEVGFLVGLITWIGIDTAPLPQRTRDDSAFLEVPYPRRRMTVTPLGTLRWNSRSGAAKPDLVRGIVSYPSVGEPVFVPDTEQLRTIGSAGTESGRVVIGTSPLGGDTDVAINPDRLFGRHLAVLGSTGSGKSCTVAGLIRWCVDAAHDAAGEGKSRVRFIILDPNGEYRDCFKDLTTVRVLRVSPQEGGEQPLRVPAWAWSSAEWSAITRASLQTHRPLLQRALRNLRNQLTPDLTDQQRLGMELRAYADIWAVMRNDMPGHMSYGKYKGFTLVLEDMPEVFDAFATFDGIDDVLAQVADMRTRHNSTKQYGDNPYVATEVQKLIDVLTAAQESTGQSASAGRFSEDMPVQFDLPQMPSQIEALLRTPDFRRDAGYTTSFLTRVRTLVDDVRLQPIIAGGDDESLSDWLNNFLGDESCSNGEVAVVDLSLLASDVVHTAVAVIGRLVMEALQHLRAAQDVVLPTVLILEEAHNFIGAGTSSSEIPTAADLCRDTFERLAREGRKFGLGLVLSSQRPSALSQTVLSQCNSFLLHRLVNHRDQDLVARLVPDSLGDLLHELPSLPPRQAILLGWATEVPTLVDIGHLDSALRPHSDDPAFWATWTGAQQTEFTWDAVVEHWLSS